MPSENDCLKATDNKRNGENCFCYQRRKNTLPFSNDADTGFACGAWSLIVYLIVVYGMWISEIIC